MVDGVVMNPAIGRTLLSIQDVQSVIDRTTHILSTNKKVNSAFDNPQNFFTSNALSNRSNDLVRLVDGIEKNISVVKEALNGVEALSALLDQAETIATESQTLQEQGRTDPNIYDHPVDATLTPLSVQILHGDPVGYWRLNETAGTTVTNLGSGGAAINGTYQGGVTLGDAGLYENHAGDSASFDGANDRILIPDSNDINLGTHGLRTVEMVFNANDVSAGAGRQVLWEEGGNVNSLNVYIDNGRIYFNTRDQNDFGPGTPNPYPTISAPIVAGQTYHAAIVFDFNGSGTVTGYLDGQAVGAGTVTRALSSHSGNIGIGSLQDSSYMHDGPSPNNTYRFDGHISDVALYNRALSAQEVDAHAQSLYNKTVIERRNSEFEKVMDQIDALVNDSFFRGQNLLSGGDITTYFNERRTSSLTTHGVDFSSIGLGIARNDFDNPDDLQAIIDSVRWAQATVRGFGLGLTNDLVILNTRLSFNNTLTNTLQEGSDKLVLADMNKQGAIMLAAQTRMNLAVTALGIATRFNSSILNLFR